MSTPAPGTVGSDDSKSPASLTEFLAKILNQLSLSSWLPGMMATLTALLLGTFLQQGNTDVTQAVLALTSNILATLVALTFGVVAVATLTQAFELQFIRILKGQWEWGYAGRRIGDIFISYHQKRRSKIQQKLNELESTSFFALALDRLQLDGRLTEEEARQVKRARAGGLERTANTEHYHVVAETGWRDALTPSEYQELEHLYRRLSQYPELESRIMPTLLGNVLRTFWNRVPEYTGPADTVVLDVYESANVKQIEQERRERSMIDLYATLCIVLLTISISWLITAPLRGISPVAFAVIFILLLVGSRLAYLAAVAAANNWVSVIASMARAHLAVGDDSSGSGDLDA